MSVPQTCVDFSMECEQPGHALVITQWKPELALSTDPTLLNLTVPETIPTVKSIWQGNRFTISVRAMLIYVSRIPTLVSYEYRLTLFMNVYALV